MRARTDWKVGLLRDQYLRRNKGFAFLNRLCKLEIKAEYLHFFRLNAMINSTDKSSADDFAKQGAESVIDHESNASHALPGRKLVRASRRQVSLLHMNNAKGFRVYEVPGRFTSRGALWARHANEQDPDPSSASQTLQLLVVRKGIRAGPSAVSRPQRGRCRGCEDGRSWPAASQPSRGRWQALR